MGIGVGFVGFRFSRLSKSRGNFVRMLDSCWISRLLDHMFVSNRSSKMDADLVFRVVGGAGFGTSDPCVVSAVLSR